MNKNYNISIFQTYAYITFQGWANSPDRGYLRHGLVARAVHNDWFCWVPTIHIPGPPDARGEGVQGHPALQDGGHEGGARQPQQGAGWNVC